jgi:hypothetical protein
MAKQAKAAEALRGEGKGGRAQRGRLSSPCPAAQAEEGRRLPFGGNSEPVVPPMR